MLKCHFADLSTNYNLPFFGNKISAGFPSPAEDFVEGKLDLNKKLIDHPSATFFVRVTGDSMINANIREGDILIVDRSIEATDNKIVIAVLNGELTVKRLKKKRKRYILAPENVEYPDLEITSDDFSIWGVVTYVIHKT